MNTSTHSLLVDGIAVDVVRKDIKNLHLAVYPPDGRVRVAAPLAVNDDAVRMAVVTRLPWIKRKRANFVAQDRQSQREYVSGESHYYLGRRYLLNVIEGERYGRVAIHSGKRIDLLVPAGSDHTKRERIFQTWYRKELRHLAEPLIRDWADRLDLPLPLWGIRKMKTRWGACNIEAGRIWINLDLIKKSRSCLDYIIVHELVHFFERNHNDRFVAIMENVMPLWRSNRDELNRAPLAHEDWSY